MLHRLEPSGESPASTQRDLFCWSLLASAALLIALAAPLLAGRIFTRDDLGAFHLPVRAFYAEQLQRGQPFDWMPQIYSGFYLTGEGQAGSYHPLHLLLYRLLPLPVAAGCQWLASYPFMLAGTWLFLRRRLRRADAAMLGSILFTFSGFNLLHFVHPNAVAVVAHIPWLLWAIDIVLVDFRRRSVALAQAGIALLTGSELLLGYPQYVWFSLLAEAAYAVFLAAAQRRAPRDGCEIPPTCRECVGCTGSSWSRLVTAKGVGVLLGGVQLLPTIDAFAHSARRSADASFASWGSLHPLNLIQLVAPYLFTNRVLGENTHELAVYLGAVPLTLMVWTLAHAGRWGSLAPLARAAGALGLAGLLLALGDYGLLYRLQTLLPVIGRFRFPCRYIVFCQLAAAVLASIGFILLTAPPPGRTTLPRQTLWKQFEVLWVLVAVSVAVAAVGLFLQGNTLIASPPAVLAGPVLIAAAAVLVALAARGVRFALVGLILLAAADLGGYGLSYAVYRGAVPLEQFVAATDKPPGGVAGRVVAAPLRFDQQGLQIGNQMTLAGWQRADGYAGLQPGQQLDYRQLPVWRAASVGWVKRSAASGAEDFIRCGTEWLKVPEPLPRVRLVSRAMVSLDPSRDIQHICVATTALSQVPLALPPSTPGTARMVAERAGRLHVRVDCAGPQLLVVAESFHPGWQAAVDGRPQAAWRINGDFLGCPVAAGRHDVLFEFRPRSLALGWLNTCVGLGLLGVCFCCGLAGRTPRNVEDPI